MDEREWDCDLIGPEHDAADGLAATARPATSGEARQQQRGSRLQPLDLPASSVASPDQISDRSAQARTAGSALPEDGPASVAASTAPHTVDLRAAEGQRMAAGSPASPARAPGTEPHQKWHPPPQPASPPQQAQRAQQGSACEAGTAETSRQAQPERAEQGQHPEQAWAHQRPADTAKREHLGPGSIPGEPCVLRQHLGVGGSYGSYIMLGCLHYITARPD